MYALAKEAIDYDPKTGTFLRKRDIHRWKKGQELGCINSAGYRVIWLGGKLHLAHRLVFLLENGEFPACEVDHINRNRADNRRENLRLANSSDNSWNNNGHVDSKTGHRNVWWDAALGKYRVNAFKRGKRYYAGSYKLLEDAVVASHKLREKLENQNF